MKQIKNLRKLANLSYFDKNTLSQVVEVSENSLYANIKRWLKAGLLISLKKGWYVTRDYYQTIPDKEAYHLFIANKLREPSYLSLEYILQKHSLLTEMVAAFTAVTVKSGRVYTNPLGRFVYRTIQDKLFLGYQVRTYGRFEVREASKAKALFDYLYLKTYRMPHLSPALLASYRFNLDAFAKSDLVEFESDCQQVKQQPFRSLTKTLKKAYDL